MLLHVLCFAVDLESYSDGNVCVEASFLLSEQLYLEVIVDVENTHVRVECFEGRYRFGFVCTYGSFWHVFCEFGSPCLFVFYGFIHA